MERGASLFHLSNPTRFPPPIPARFLLSYARSPLRCSIGRSHCQHSGPRKPMLADFFRSFPCWRESYHVVHMALRKLQFPLRALSSCEPQGIAMDGKETARNNSLIDCGADQECVVGGVVALGKFDALHIGHRELAIQASKAGVPFLLSFVGIAEVLGWAPRLPIVATCDRKRVLSTWAPFCGDILPLEYTIQFSSVRHLAPRQFVEKLSKDLRVAGVVAGENYRFGYKASGTAHDLTNLCEEYGVSSYIIPDVSDDVGEVSSTRVRRALAAGDTDRVAKLLGRRHRLVLCSANKEYEVSEKRVTAPIACVMNQPPGDGEFRNCKLVLGDDVCVGLCKVVIDSCRVRIEMDRSGPLDVGLVPDGHPIGIEFAI